MKPTEQEHCTSPLQHYCDIRSPVCSMTSSKLCTVVLFMKDTENVKNYFKTEVEPNSILPRAYHTIDSLWFKTSQNTLTLTTVCPQKQKETMTVNPLLGIINLNMSCTATSSYLILLPYCHNESKLNVQAKFIDNLISYNGSNLQIWKPFISTIPYLIKMDIPTALKDTKEIPCETFNFNCLQIEKIRPTICPKVDITLNIQISYYLCLNPLYSISCIVETK